jgi:phage terminase large subunit
MLTVEPKIWRPHKRQEQFLQLPDDIYEALYGGAAGGGKSEVLLLLPIARQFYKHPHFKGIILRRTFPELEKEIILRSQEYYPQTGGVYNEKHHRWSWEKIGGGYMEFGHAEHEKDIKKYDTAEYNYIGIDEVTSFTEFQYLYLALTRCRTSDSDLPAIVRSATNPGNIGHGWCRKRFVEPCRDGGKIIVDKKTQSKRIFIPAKLTDNTTLMRTDPTYYSRMMMLPEAERRAKVDGDWWTFSGQVFEDFRDKKFPGEPDNALHVVKPFDIPAWWPRFAACDWGFQAMAWIGLAAVSPENRVIVYKELTFKRQKIAIWADEVGRELRKDGIDSLYLDPSAWQNRGEDKQIWQQIQEASGLNMMKADNDRVSGKTLIQEYLRWEQKRKSVILESYNPDVAQRVLRMQGLAAYHTYLASFIAEKDETNLPKLQIFDTCPCLIETIPLCVYAKDEASSGKKAEDVAEFGDDDPYDGFRYLIKAAHRYIISDDKKDNQLKKEHIQNEFHRTKDNNYYYRAMEKLESKHKEVSSVKVSSLFRRKNVRPTTSNL